MAATESTATARGPVPGLAKIVGFLVCVELASGILQGYYTPIYQDIAHHLSIQDASVNWFEAAQLVVSALAVPFLARLGDLVGARNVLLLSTAVTALGSWILAFAPGFTTFLIGFAIQGAYVVWLPMEVAIVYRRTSVGALMTRRDQLTRRAAGILVGALELAVIIGAVTSGALVGATSFTVVLMVPAIVVTAALVVIWFGIERDPPTAGGRIDLGGLALISLSIGLVMGGLIAIRLQGPGHPLGWVLIVAGLVTLAAVRPLRAAPGRAAGRRPPARQPAAVAGPGHRVPVRDVGARRADPAVDVRPDRPRRRRLRPRRDRRLRVDPDRRLRHLPGDRRLHPAAHHPLARAAQRPRRCRPCWWPSATACGCPSTTRPPRRWSTWRSPASARARSSRRSRPAPPRGHPPDRTAFATGMTNATKTMGGAIASAVFAIALSSTGSIKDPVKGHAPLHGYLVVWSVCAAAALLAALGLLLMPRATAVRED